ncbi:MAG: autotransporter outer membrane beta-barrel domain-containing protein, partial [Schwartzia sp. (in: firmicutes)]
KDAQDVVGGSAGNGSAEGNKVTVDGGSFHDIIGGESTTGGSADKNEVKLTNLKAISGALVGGAALGTGSTSGNTVDVSSEDGALAVTGAITGGRAADGSAENNTVKLTNLKTGAAVMGGNAAKVTVEKANVTKNTVEIAGGKFSAVTGGATNGGDATENTVTLKGATTGAVTGGDVTVSGSAKENTVTVDGGKVVSVTGGSARAADGDAAKNTVTLTNQVDVTGSVLGGEAPAGKAEENKVEITGGKIGGSVFAGLTTNGDATGNEVTLRQVEVNGVPAPGDPAGVAGGAASVSGNANSNTVTIEGNETGTKRIVKGDVAGGSTANGDASSNVVSLKDIEVRHAVYGGQGTGKTNDNTVRLSGVTVGGTVYGGTGAAESLNNTLEIYGKASTIGDFSGVQNLHFYVDSDRVNDKTALLTLTSSGAKDIKGLGLGIKFAGDAKILHTGDQMTLLKASGALTTDDTIENKFTGSHGSSLHYEFDIAKAATDDKTLVATVKAAGMKEETKSYVETRAALADMVNHAGDVVAGESLSSAKKAAAAASANAEMDRYQVWAGMGANAMRAESGSYVDTKGWSFGLGWARQDGGAAKKTLFSPFVEYGCGNYDSYLDNGTHGSGSMSYFGLGVLARMESAKGLWYEGSVRGGRSTSDYSGNGVSYDGDNTYYGAHLGIGRDIKMKDSDTVTPYLRYFYSHQNSMTATLTSGETYDFGSVNSHRIRLGVKYAHAVSEANEFYAGLAYEYEFNGDATATFQGFSTPTPSLKGSSGMLELGYRFTPEGQPLTYDLHLTGWQGIRRGFSGGAQVTWAF